MKEIFILFSQHELSPGNPPGSIIDKSDQIGFALFTIKSQIWAVGNIGLPQGVDINMGETAAIRRIRH